MWATDMLGLAMRARKVISGTESVVKALRAGTLHLVVLATDASENTKKKVRDKSSTYGVEVLETLTSDEISTAIGKRDIKAIGLTDKGFGQTLSNQIRK